MLELKDIRKDYPAGGGEVVHALQGVSARFRDAEFVAVLGQSGCGKTTLLNIIGGLDQYTSGDLVINGRSTKDYSDRDWDTYRNHSIGFVFQSYNLIGHQTVLANVELALTLSGVGKRERRQRAIEALKAVGLGDQIDKRPNQLSGGQMQRVAIARALINNPEIVLADEPTGALDSQTSVQVMEILKEVSRDRLVIMVTHNPELAQTYATRVIHLLDGVITSDSDPFEPQAQAKGADAAAAAEATAGQTTRERRRAEKAADQAAGKGKRRMSLGTALGLSMRNLMTKKGRTILTAFAGSIGIIGIALILSLSHGTQSYINQVEQDTLSSYPIEIDAQTMDLTSMMQAVGAIEGAGSEEASTAEGDSAGSASDGSSTPDGVTTYNVMTNIISTVSQGQSKNDLASFRAYLESDEGAQLVSLANDIRYGYETPLYVYSADTSEGVLQVNPSTLLSNIGLSGFSSQAESDSSGDSIVASLQSMSSMSSQVDVWEQLLNNDEVLASQYEVLAGRAPERYDEVVLITDKEGRVSDYLLYALGIKDQSEITGMLDDILEGEELKAEPSQTLAFDDFVGMTFKLVLPSDLYQEDADGVWQDISDNEAIMRQVVDDAETLTIVGVICPQANASISEGFGAIGYRTDLTEHVVEEVNGSALAQAQKDNPDTDVFTGLPFASSAGEDEVELSAEVEDYIASLSESQQTMARSRIEAAHESGMTNEQINQQFELMISAMGGSTATDGETSSTDSSAADEQAASETSAVSRMMAAMGVQSSGDSEGSDGSGSTNSLLAGLLASSGSAASASAEPAVSKATYEGNLTKIGVADVDSPDSIQIYAKDFTAKEQITDLIEQYNSDMRAAGEDGKVLQYADYIGLLIGSVRTVIDAISYILIAFVAISLVVSSIMIGIITYISVLERTKEIGILRAVGASKRDVSRVFNAETFTIGLIAGVLGILITLLLDIPANIIIENVAGVHNLAQLPWQAAILVLVSVLLTMVGGLIPAGIASRRDPVAALRTE